MTLRALWERLTGHRQRSGALVINLHSDDEMDLGMALLNADERLRASLGLDGANFLRVHRALTECAMQEFQKGRVTDDVMVPIRLSEQDWKAIFAFCLIAKDQIQAKWPIRVIARIAAETAKVYPDLAVNKRREER